MRWSLWGSCRILVSLVALGGTAAAMAQAAAAFATLSNSLFAKDAIADNAALIALIERRPAARLLTCGDGFPDPGEECDDGNTVSGDGCSATCQLEVIVECQPTVNPQPQNILQDGSFENHNENGEWVLIEHSLFGPDLICDDACFGLPFAAAADGSLTSGNLVVIAGGSFSGDSSGRVIHAPVAIPAQATTLEFQWATLASGPAGDPCAGPDDGLSLLIDGTYVWSSLDGGSCVNVNPYQRVVIDLAVAAGGPYQGRTVDFEFHATATGIPPSIDLTTVMLDDVSINLPPIDPPPPDCEGDGVPDSLDNCLLVANADQFDADGDGYGNACDADFNQDCIVNALDLGLFRQAFFSSDMVSDLNGDGIVNVVDLGLIKNQYFTAPGPGAGGVCVP